MGLVIHSISSETVELVVELLQERNATLADYTRWKYRHPAGRCPRGFVATLDGAPIGCFGLIPRRLALMGQGQIDAGWFADWYVRPRARGGGLGRQLLDHVTYSYPVVFGHPGTPRAQALCRSKGYRAVGFQSRRRLVLRPWIYQRQRTRYRTKAGAAMATAVLRRALNRFRLPDRCGEDRSSVSFDVSPEYLAWLQAQPVRVGMCRSTGTWRADGVEIVYCDDRPTDGMPLRRVLYWAGSQSRRPSLWNQFFRDARLAGCTHVELFTTDRLLDQVWRQCGALPLSEPQVVVVGLLDVNQIISLHGCDRENWTFLA